MPTPIFQTPEYKDNGHWINTYSNLKQLEKVGQAKGMVIPRERPESPNARLRAAGIAVQESPLLARGIGMNLDSLPTQQMLGQQLGLNQETEIPQQQLNAMFGGVGQRPQQQQFMPPQQQQQQQMCRLVEGTQIFNPVDLGGFMAGGPAIVCKPAGIAQGQFCNLQYAVNGVKNCYVVKLNETTINMGVINSNPQLWVKLVEIRGAMGRSILVPQNGLRSTNAPQQSRMLNDSNVRRPMTTNGQPSRILMG